MRISDWSSDVCSSDLHVGVFPEQIVHWEWMKRQVETAGRPIKVLNLFGYTGVASLVAASAGAEVTHVDASKKAIGRSEERRVGKECVSTCRSRGAAYH